MDGKDIIPYIDPVYHFCYHRLNSRCDAEDLAGEILCHVLAGLGKYEIVSLDAWVWRIAHNRYARFIEDRRKRRECMSDRELHEVEDCCCTERDYCQIDEESVEDEFAPVFRCLHRLSSEYRNIFIDYYMGEMSVKQLSRKYSLSETTIKWRLNAGRTKIREWIGGEKMEKVYQRINWNTSGCNGQIDTGRYLHTQIARAICKAAYEKPLTVEEISACTGIPAMYIEDELPRLEYGEAVRNIGNKYAADFIVLRLEDRAQTESASASMVKEIADYYEAVLWGKDEALRKIGFYGSEAGIARLGYIFIPYLIRMKVCNLRNCRLNLSDGNFPPRKDGGYGWFIVQETEDEKENVPDTNTGCNSYGGTDSKGKEGHYYYYWIMKYEDRRIYDGMQLMQKRGIPGSCRNGMIPEGMLDEDELLSLLQANLIRKDGKGHCLNFACFTREQLEEVRVLFEREDAGLDDLLAKWILSVQKSFERFVPRRLHSQVNQWAGIYSYEVLSLVTEELISRGRLAKPDPESPLADSVFWVEGSFFTP